MRAEPVPAFSLDGMAGRWIMAVALVMGLAWSFLPQGLEFDAKAREAASLVEGGHGLFAVQWGPLILLSLIVATARFRWFTLVSRHLNPWFVLILIWAYASAFWAPDSFKVFKQVTGVTGVNLLALAFGLAAWNPNRFSTVMVPMVVFCLAASLLVGLALPQVGIHSEQQFELNGSWRGITYQKNMLGQLGAFGAILCFHAWCARQGRSTWMMVGTLLSLLMIVLSRSSTSLMMTLVTCSVLFFQLRDTIRAGEHGGTVKAGLLLVVIAPLISYMVVIGSVNPAELAQSFGEIFGKDGTFSGRTYIWKEVLREIGGHPWVGVGFNSFWHTPLAAETISRLGWPCPSAHNGYLDVINELGLVGITLLILLIVRHFRDCSRLARFDPAQAALHRAIILYVVLANLTESGWMVALSFSHIIAGYSSVTLSRLLCEAELQALRARDASAPPQWNPKPLLPAGSLP